MMDNQLDNAVTKKDKLLKLSVRQIRQEAKKLSIHLYSRKTKAALVNLIIEYKKRVLIENDIHDELVSAEEKIALEKVKAAAEEKIALEKVKAAAEEKIALRKTKVEKETTIISNKNEYLKDLLSKLFPDKKISVIDNKEGSQTILIL